MSQYSPQLLDILVKRATDIVAAEDYVHWAIFSLEQGADTPNLRILASLPTLTWPSEAEFYFNWAVAELQIHIGTDAEILREYAKQIARKILTGELAAETGAGIIECQVVSPLEHPDDLMAWCYLSGGLEPTTFATLTGSELDEAIRRQAARLVDSEPQVCLPNRA